jgi:hypothetical protein
MTDKESEPKCEAGEIIISGGEVLDGVVWDWVIVCIDPRDSDYIIIACTSPEVPQPVRRVARETIVNSFFLAERQNQVADVELQEVLTMNNIPIWGDK